MARFLNHKFYPLSLVAALQTQNAEHHPLPGHQQRRDAENWPGHHERRLIDRDLSLLLRLERLEKDGQPTPVRKWMARLEHCSIVTIKIHLYYMNVQEAVCVANRFGIIPRVIFQMID